MPFDCPDVRKAAGLLATMQLVVAVVVVFSCTREWQLAKIFTISLLVWINKFKRTQMHLRCHMYIYVSVFVCFMQHIYTLLPYDSRVCCG